MKYLYAILFTDKISKVGYTSNLPSRILSHKHHAKTMGKSILSMWVTAHPVKNHSEAEKQMIAAFSEKFTPLTDEFFGQSDECTIKKILSSFSFHLMQCQSVSYKGSNLLIEVACNEKRQSRKPSDQESILKLLTRAGADGMNIGAIRGGRRSIDTEDIEKILEELCSDGLIARTIKKHQGNNREFYVYRAV